MEQWSTTSDKLVLRTGNISSCNEKDKSTNVFTYEQIYESKKLKYNLFYMQRKGTYLMLVFLG